MIDKLKRTIDTLRGKHKDCKYGVYDDDGSFIGCVYLDDKCVKEEDCE